MTRQRISDSSETGSREGLSLVELFLPCSLLRQKLLNLVLFTSRFTHKVEREIKRKYMSLTNEQLATIVDFQADLDFFISEKNWKEAALVIESVGEMGYETEALYMHQMYNRARDLFLKEIEQNRKEKVLERIHNSFINAVESDEREDPRDIADRDYPRE